MGQSEQEKEPATLYRPRGHVTIVMGVVPAAVQAYPAGHVVHTDAPAALYCPLLHMEVVADPGMGQL
jgi:hypothetical protein